MILHIFAIAFTLLMFLMIVKGSSYDRPLFIILYVTTIYYGYLAPLYWIEIELGRFLGVDWNKDINYSCFVLMAGTIFFSASVFLWNSFSVFFGHKEFNYTDNFNYIYPAGKVKFLMGLACVGIFYVLIFAVLSGGVNPDDPVLKIAYQFGDLAIPAILYIIGYFGFGFYQVVLVALFLAYSITLGFRYKLVLLFMPMVISYIFKNFERGGVFAGINSLLRAFVFGLLLLALFSLMTITRQKFGGLDLSVVGDQSGNDVLYGFFAEGNTIFALTSIIVNFVDFDRFYYLQPISDALLDWVPRFIAPWRNTAQYVDDVLIGLLVPEARLSGTAYPYIGEFLLMYGYPAVFIGIMVVSGLYVNIKNRLISSGSSIEVKYIGIGLLAVFFGYYYFSRGLFSQSLKGFIFLVVPYYYLLNFKSGLGNKY